MTAIWLLYAFISVVCAAAFIAFAVWDGHYHSETVSVWVMAAIYGLVFWITVPCTIAGWALYYLFKGAKYIHRSLDSASRKRASY